MKKYFVCMLLALIFLFTVPVYAITINDYEFKDIESVYPEYTYESTEQALNIIMLDKPVSTGEIFNFDVNEEGCVAVYIAPTMGMFESDYINVYDKDGNFLYGLKYNADNNEYVVWLEGHLSIVSTKGGTYVAMLNDDGSIADAYALENDSLLIAYAEEKERNACGYTFAHLGNRIVRKNSDGKEIVIHETPAYTVALNAVANVVMSAEWIIGFSFPIVLAIVLPIVINRKVRNRKTRQ